MQLLRLLSDGEFHSGEELGAALGISRTAVWKQVKLWRKRGLEITAATGKGYCLLAPLEWWSSDLLLKGLSDPAKSSLRVLEIRECVTSTNDVVLELLQSTGHSGVACLAEEQSEGRGRRGRQWLSPFGSNFYGSIGWVFQGISVVEGLSLAFGVAIVRALKRYGMSNAQLKWPNDIVVGAAKLGGVLIELQAEADGPCRVVIGVGLNMLLPVGASDFLGREVTDVSQQTGIALRKNELGALLLDELLCLLQSYETQGFSAVREEWLSHDALCDADVVVTGLDKELFGVARGVDEHGALRLETKEGVRLLHGGEVSMKRVLA
jgi:BirA family biotin operon repressor/biotin-[acetyl-CoA-carboxylase] ligase